MSYPIEHVPRIVTPISKGDHPKNIIFLTADAFGVLPPVAKLTEHQAMYQFISGYTAKIAGTEIGITQPKATFSPCFGAPFLTLHPTKYAAILKKKITKHKVNAYLVNTGWSGGPYGTGKRMSIKVTRAIIDAIHSGEIEKEKFQNFPIFNLQVPTKLKGVDPSLFIPKNTWKDKIAYDTELKKLALLFQKNFKKYTQTKEGQLCEKSGPAV